jgi:ribosomal protein S5
MRAIGFFNKTTGDELWKCVRTVNKNAFTGGKKPKKRVYKNLNKNQNFGRGRLQTEIPGISVPIIRRPANVLLPGRVDDSQIVTSIRVTATNRDFEQNYVDQLANQKGVGALKRERGRLPPLDRGFSGVGVMGRYLGPPEPEGGRTFEGFECVCVDIKKVSHATGAEARNMRTSVLVLCGNFDGLVGWTVNKHPNLHQALNSARSAVGRKLEFIERRENRTIYQAFWAEMGHSRLYARPAPPGAGLNCHRALIVLCQLLGIKDIYVRTEGSTSNKLNIVKAFMTGLRNQETFQQLAERKRLHVVEFDPTRGYLPKVIASPKESPVRTEAQIGPNEVMDVDEVYGVGRYPWRPLPGQRFAEQHPAVQNKLFLEHPFRNRRQQRIRLQVEGVCTSGMNPVACATVSKEWHREMLEGRRVLPRGIGLPDVRRKSVRDGDAGEEVD